MSNVPHRTDASRSAPHGRQELDVLLVCSAGGHLMQLHLLRPAWENRRLRAAWVTIDREDARTLLAGEDVVFAYSPTTRSLKNLVRNAYLAWRVLRARRPRTIVTTGAGVAVPFAWVGRMMGISTVYVESLTRIDRLSLSGRLIRPFADRVYCQWPELADSRRGLRYVGQVISRT